MKVRRDCGTCQWHVPPRHGPARIARAVSPSEKAAFQWKDARTVGRRRKPEAKGLSDFPGRCRTGCARPGGGECTRRPEGGCSPCTGCTGGLAEAGRGPRGAMAPRFGSGVQFHATTFRLEAEASACPKAFLTQIKRTCALARSSLLR